MGLDHPEDWVRHGQYITQPITCTNGLNVIELNVGGGVLLGCMCVCTIATTFPVVAVRACLCTCTCACVCVYSVWEDVCAYAWCVCLYVVNN